MKIEYTKQGNYLIPDLIMQNIIKNFNIGKFGRLRLEYIKENRPSLYQIMLMKNTLQKHLIDIDIQANKRYELLIHQFVEKENITESLKETNQMKWIGLMNNIKNSAEEIIIKELIYV